LKGLLLPLVIVPTPIGNLTDITFRAVDALKNADIIACEDTRTTMILLDRYGIKKPLTAYHEHNERAAAKRLLSLLREGKTVALVSDAGTPLISDPGYHLLHAAIDAGVKVEALPGANTVTTAVAVAGLPVHAFAFLGYPPRKPGKLRNFLSKHAGFEGTLVFFEAPERVAGLLEGAAEVFGGDAPAALCRELTKVFEEVKRGTAKALAETCRATPPRGECTVLVFPDANRRKRSPQNIFDRKVSESGHPDTTTPCQ
jgi:16S rRNA (cytidine1402-2'-O)-methyltransferase